MELGSIMGYSAIFAGIAMAWNKIRIFFSHISSFVIENYQFEDYGSFFIFTSYVNFSESGFKRLSLAKKSIFYLDEYIKPFDRNDRVLLFRTIFGNGAVYKRGKTFIIVKSAAEGADPPAASNSDSSYGKSKGSVTFLRGTVNIKNLLKESADYYYKIKEKEVNSSESKKESRFYVIQYRQPRFFPQNQQDPTEAYPAPSRGLSVKACAASTTGIKEAMKGNDLDIISFDLCDLGEEDNKSSSFSHLAFPGYISGFIEEADRWHKSRKWFIDNKIPWKRGWLLYGPPGNGKSSLARSLAEYLGIPLIIFDISTMDNESFSSKWQEAINAHAPCIMLIEDIDAVFNKRTNLSGEGKLTFDCLLNNISGADKADGAFLIVTTNNLDSIDAALGRPVENGEEFQSTRPGRIDRVLELKNPTKECRLQIASRILKEVPSLIEETVNHGEGESGAQFQERCAQIALKHFWENKKGE